MVDMEKIIDQLFGIFSVEFVLMVVLIGLFLIFVDSKRLKKKDLLKDYRIAKFLGYCYTLIGIGLFFWGN